MTLRRIEVTLQDHLAAQRAHYWSIWMWLLLTAAVAGVAAFPIVAFQHRSASGMVLLPGLFILSGAVLGGVLGGAIASECTARRHFRQLAAWSTSSEVRWDDQAIQLDSSLGHTQLPWSKFLKVREHPRVLVLYLTSRSFLVLPRRAFTATDLAQILGHLAPVARRRR